MNDYRDFLAHSFREKRERNPSYSLRAFARDMAISPSRLSEVMSGKGNLSRRKAQAIAKKLQYTPAKTQYFLDLLDSLSLSADVRKRACLRLKAVAQDKVEIYLPNVAFEPIATWQHIAVWSFLFLPAFDGDCLTIARSLKIDIFDVYSILQQLQAAKLAKSENRYWIAAVSEFSSGDDVPSQVIRKYHDSVSCLGRKAIEQQTISERHLETLILPFNSRRIDDVGRHIGSFVQGLSKEFGEESEGDSVYAMSLQFFRVGDKPSQKAIS